MSAMLERDRMPSLKALFGAYYAAKRENKTEAIAGGCVPCEVCLRLALPNAQAARIPFIRGFNAPAEGQDGKIADRVVWAEESCCVPHARHVAWATRALTRPTAAYVEKFPAALFGKPWLDSNPPPRDFDAPWLAAVTDQCIAIDAQHDDATRR